MHRHVYSFPLDAPSRARLRLLKERISGWAAASQPPESTFMLDSSMRCTSPTPRFCSALANASWRGWICWRSDMRLLGPGRGRISSRQRSRWHRWQISTAILIGVSVLAVCWVQLRRGPSLLDQGWAPVFSNPGPVLVAASYAPAYLPQESADSGSPFNFTRLSDQFVGGGDLLAAAKVSGMLSRVGHPSVVYGPTLRLAGRG